MFWPSVITYDGLPISSGGAHTLRTRSPRLALAQVQAFIASCSDVDEPQEGFVEVLTGGNVPNDFSAPLIRKFSDELGVSRRRARGGADTAHVWPVAPQKLEIYAPFIEQLQPLPAHPFKLQPVAVTATYKFKLTDVQSGIVLPNQGSASYHNVPAGHGRLLGESTLYARFSERSTVSLFLSFPFEEVSESFLRSVAFVQEHLPFRLSAGHWKQWRVTKNGASYVGRKLPFKGRNADTGLERTPGAS